MFNTNWNCQQHITTCKKAKAKGMTSPSQGQLSMGVLTPKKSPTGSSPFKRLKCQKCNRILASSWHYAQHVKKCKAKGKGKSVSDDVDKVEVKMPSQPTSPVKSEPASPMKVSPKGSPGRAGKFSFCQFLSPSVQMVVGLCASLFFWSYMSVYL